MGKHSSIIECQDLGKTYQAAVPVVALQGATLSIYPGELVCLVGRSGSGKTTLLTLLGLLDKPTAGHLYVDGKDTIDLSSRERDSLRRQQLGFVFQAFNLVPELSASANVEMSLRYQRTKTFGMRQRVEAALEQVGLSQRLHSRVNTMSGGEQQRVAVARALVKNPSILLADEPTGNLDSANEALIIGLLKDAATTGAAVIVVTHSEEIASQADRVFRLHDGNVEADS